MDKAEKFILDNTIDNDGSSDIINWYYKRLLTPDVARKAVEIAREETLDKVYKYIKDNLYKNLYVYNGEAGFPTFQFIEDLKQAMKDE